MIMFLLEARGIIDYNTYGDWVCIMTNMLFMVGEPDGGTTLKINPGCRLFNGNARFDIDQITWYNGTWFVTPNIKI